MKFLNYGPLHVKQHIFHKKISFAQFVYFLKELWTFSHVKDLRWEISFVNVKTNTQLLISSFKNWKINIFPLKVYRLSNPKSFVSEFRTLNSVQKMCP